MLQRESRGASYVVGVRRAIDLTRYLLALLHSALAPRLDDM